jgi:hypothetical protein
MRVPRGWGSHILRQSTHEGDRAVSPTHRPPLPPRKYSWYSFLLEAESIPRAIVRPEGLCQWKFPVTPSGIKPAPFRFVMQCLNQLRHRVPHLLSVSSIKIWLLFTGTVSLLFDPHSQVCKPKWLHKFTRLVRRERKRWIQRENITYLIKYFYMFALVYRLFLL